MLLQNVNADPEYLSFVIESDQPLQIPQNIPLLLCTIRTLLPLFVTIFNKVSELIDFLFCFGSRICNFIEEFVV
jgi:hypothetical protein